MSDKRHLVYIDILGFEELARIIALKKGIEPRVVRERFITVIKERIAMVKTKGKIIGQFQGTDDWTLVIDGSENVFQSILAISEHNTGYLDYEKIPLEIAVGLADFDKWAQFDGERLSKKAC